MLETERLVVFVMFAQRKWCGQMYFKDCVDWPSSCALMPVSAMAARNRGFDGENPHYFLKPHVAFPGLRLRHWETPPASSISLVLHCGNPDKLLFCSCGGDSVLDTNMKHCREQPLTLFFFCFFPFFLLLNVGFLCPCYPSVPGCFMVSALLLCSSWP